MSIIIRRRPFNAAALARLKARWRKRDAAATTEEEKAALQVRNSLVGGPAAKTMLRITDIPGPFDP